MRTLLVAILLFAASSANAQQVAPDPEFIRENSPVIALTHVQLIDGTGAAAQADQTIVIDHGKIAALGSAASTNVKTISRFSIIVINSCGLFMLSRGRHRVAPDPPACLLTCPPFWVQS
jgi:hypothetical protein